MTFIPNSDFYLRVAQGLVPGYGPVNKFGENDDVASDTQEDVWDGGGTYVWPTSASLTHLRSAVNSAITQDVLVEVQGLDTNWALVVQDATTNAADSTTEVALTTALRRVFRVKVKDDTMMDENLQIGPSGFATQGAIVVAGHNQTLMALYSVPLGKTAYLSSYYGDIVQTTNKEPRSVDFKLWVADAGLGYAFQMKHEKGIPGAASGFQHFFQPPLKIEEKHDIVISATPDNDPAHAHAGFDITLIDN